MRYSLVSIKELNTIADCMDAIASIEQDPENYNQADRKDFYAGALCSPCKRAQDKIAAINKRMDKLSEELEEVEVEDQMDVEDVAGGVDIGYIRVSSVDQNEARQLDGVKVDRVFTDKCSGGSVDRPQLDELKRYVRQGDTVHVHSIDRLARSLDDLRTLVRDWMSTGVTVRFHKEGLTFTAGDNSPMAELMLNMLGAVAQFERSMIRERQREGIAKAKEKGVYTGRKKSVDEAAILEMLDSGVSIRKTAEALGLGVSTVQRAKKARDEAKRDAGL